MRETRTARLEVISEKIVLVKINPNATQNLADARENIDAAIAVAGNRKPALMVDIRMSNPLEAEVRHFYGSMDLFPSFSAFGLLVDASPLGVMMGNIYFKVARFSVPSKLFNEEDKCISWLEGKIK